MRKLSEKPTHSLYHIRLPEPTADQTTSALLAAQLEADNPLFKTTVDYMLLGSNIASPLDLLAYRHLRSMVYGLEVSYVDINTKNRTNPDYRADGTGVRVSEFLNKDSDEFTYPSVFTPNERSSEEYVRYSTSGSVLSGFDVTYVTYDEQTPFGDLIGVPDPSTISAIRTQSHLFDGVNLGQQTHLIPIFVTCGSRLVGIVPFGSSFTPRIDFFLGLEGKVIFMSRVGKLLDLLADSRIPNPLQSPMWDVETCRLVTDLTNVCRTLSNQFK